MKNIVDIDYVNEKERKLTQLFISSTSIKKYILGINKFTRSVLEYIKVDGIIDDFTRVQNSRKKSILKISDISAENSIILCTVMGSPLEVQQTLNDMGFINFNYLAFYKYTSLNLLDPPFIVDFKDDFIKNRDRYEELYGLLEDEKSREIFEKIINFKVTFDFSFMEGFTNNHEEQYFDKALVGDIKNISFLDGGGYVGDTALEVIKRFPDIKKLYLIEPIAKNIEIAKRIIGNHSGVEFFCLGLSNKKTTLYFNEEKSFSNIYGFYGDTIEVDTIDNIIKQSVDFIKLDIEGAEADAIEGAKNTIKNYQPILAICIYHKAKHWYEVPEKVLEINPNYKIYIRHYMEGIFETVMYFIPKNRYEV